MRGKLLLVAGLAVGYVVGARAGRPAYDALTARFDDVASSPRVRDAVAGAKAELEEKAPAVAGALGQAAQAAAETVTAVQEAPSGTDGEDAPQDTVEDAGTPTAEPPAQTAPAQPAAAAPKAPGAAKPAGSRRVRSSGGAPAKADG